MHNPYQMSTTIMMINIINRIVKTRPIITIGDVFDETPVLIKMISTLQKSTNLIYSNNDSVFHK